MSSDDEFKDCEDGGDEFFDQPQPEGAGQPEEEQKGKSSLHQPAWPCKGSRQY